ncbi:MAG TPA: AAA family ATPase [Candidatus Saccharimonadia bacterium]|nr:AAA family ATPase [Candidatus Saccharimonadia bacterium]
MPAIVLNGTSSAGKTSIAKAIQKLSPEPFIHISLDDFTEMFRWDAIDNADLRRECHRHSISSFHQSMRVLLAGQFPGVIDHVFEQDAWYEGCLTALAEHDILVVGVHCPLKVVRHREVARGDRRIGLAEYQLPIVHKNRRYDLEVDTSTRSSEECAAEILTAYRAKAGAVALK